MQIKKALVFVFFVLVGVSSATLQAAPLLIEIEQLDFSEIVPITGECNMDYTTGAITDNGGSTMCLNSPTGTPGHYRLFVTSNKDYNIMLETRVPVGSDGITFVPSGELSSDVESVAIVADSYVTVNSGTNGQINIIFGGRLTLAQPVTGGTVYEVDEGVKISYEETP